MKTRRSAKEPANDNTSQSQSEPNSNNEDSRSNSTTAKRIDMPKLSPVSQPGDEQKTERAKPAAASQSTIKKRILPKLRSVPAPYNWPTPKKTESTQKEDPNDENPSPTPTSERNPASSPSEAKKSAPTKKANIPLPSRAVAAKKTRTGVVKPSRQLQTRKRSATTNAPNLGKRHPSSTTRVPLSRRTSTEKKPSSRSIFDLRLEERPGRKLQRMPASEATALMAESQNRKRMKANRKKKTDTPLAQNNSDLARTNSPPFPVDEDLPPVPRKGTRRTATTPSGKVGKPQSEDGAARNTTRKTISHKQSPPMTRSRNKLEQPASDGAGNSCPRTSSKNSGDRLSQPSIGSQCGGSARKAKTNTRDPITFPEGEYDSKSPPGALQDTKVHSSQLEAESSEHESISSRKSDDNDSESESYEYSSYSDSESEDSPPKRGKTIPEQTRRVMVTRSNLENRPNDVKQKIKGTSEKSIDKPTVQEPVAGKSIAGKSLAGKTVAGKTTGGKTLAGKTAARRKGAGKMRTGKTIADKTIAGKTIAGKTIAGKTVAGKTIAGKTIAGKTIAGKTIAGKTIAGKTLPQRNIPRRIMRAGGIGHDPDPDTEADHEQQKMGGKTLRTCAKPQTESDGNHIEGDQDDAASALSSGTTSGSDNTSDDEDSENDSGTEDSETEDSDSNHSDDVNNRGDEREAQRVVSHGNRSAIDDYENRRKEMREKCSKQLQKQEKKRYSTSVKEEFFLEMEYHMYLKREVTQEDQARGQIHDPMTFFERNIAPLRLEGLESLGCDLEAQNYRSWLNFFCASGRVLQKTSDPRWKGNFLSILSSLKSARSSTNAGEASKRQNLVITDSQLNFMIENWQLLSKAVDLLNMFSSEMLNIQTAGGGCQLQ